MLHSLGFKERSALANGHYVYTKKFPFDPSKHADCTLNELRQNGKYYIRKYTYDEGSDDDYNFEAVLHKDDDDDFLAELYGNRGGGCNDVKTKRPARSCGLATDLMYSCMADTDVTKNGGVDVANDPIFNADPKRKNAAMQNCQAIVFLMGAPPDNANAAIAYLRAAKKANYKMLFTHSQRFPTKDHPDIIDVMKIEKAITEFDKRGEEFQKNHGAWWYFCKCKLLKTTQCQRMT